MRAVLAFSPHHDVVGDTETLSTPLQEDLHASMFVRVDLVKDVEVRVKLPPVGLVRLTLEGLVAVAAITLPAGVHVFQHRVPPAQHFQAHADRIQQLVSIAKIQALSQLHANHCSSLGNASGNATFAEQVAGRVACAAR